jgi:hypothetical protein
MRLSEVIELPELKKRDIVVIGHITTDSVFAVLAKRGEKVFPFPRFFHLVEDGPSNTDPEVGNSELDSILRRFGYVQPISTFPAK